MRKLQIDSFRFIQNSEIETSLWNVCHSERQLALALEICR
jgi:hypothetical protein